MRLIIFILLFGMAGLGHAQDSVQVGGAAASDTLGGKERVGVFEGPGQEAVVWDTVRLWQAARREVLGRSGLALTAPGWFFLQREKEEVGRERVFYYLLFLLLFFGVLKMSYPRYFTDAYRYYFQSTLRIHQVREQLSHAALASFLFNLLFFFSAGAYLYLMAEYYQLSFRVHNLWLPLISIAVLLIVYGGKYIFLSVLGWAFRLEKAASVYLFITYLTNKLIGITLLPLLPCIAFMPEPLNDFFVILSGVILILLYAYRLFRAYQPIHDEFSIGFGSYLLYLIAFEVVPLLLIYKLLIQIL